MSDNWQHFRRAAEILVGPGAVKQRLCDAYLKSLQEVNPDALPREVRMSYAVLATALNGGTAMGRSGAVEVAVRKMSEPEAVSHASSVLAMFIALSGHDAGEQPAPAARQLRLVGNDEIPAFLSRA
jgi:hypothetical protein